MPSSLGNVTEEREREKRGRGSDCLFFRRTHERSLGRGEWGIEKSVPANLPLSHNSRVTNATCHAAAKLPAHTHCH